MDIGLPGVRLARRMRGEPGRHGPVTWQFTTTQDIDLDAYAVFGHADFDLTES